MALEHVKPNGDILVVGAVLVTMSEERRHYLWKVQLEAAGETSFHWFPPDTMEWRSAEYGIDPGDRETLLDVVLAEGWFFDGIDPLEHPSSLYNSETIDEARDFHLSRVAVVKADHSLASAPQNKRALMRSTSTDPREHVKKNSVFNREIIVAKREIVAIGRDRIRTRREKIAEAKVVERSTGFRLMSGAPEEFTPQMDDGRRLEILQHILKGKRSYGGNSDD